MVAALKSRRLAALPATDPMHIRLTPLSKVVGKRGLAFRGAGRRERLNNCPPLEARSNGPNKSGDDEPFSLRDSETLGNIGVVGVLATAVVVGGALVILNPYAGQKIKQETIKIAEVPTPLPAKPQKSFVKPPPAPPIAAQPIPKPATPPVVTTPKPAPAPAPAPKKPSATVALPAVKAKPAAQSGQGGSNTTLIGGLIAVAAIGGGVAYFARNSEENGFGTTTAAESESSAAAPNAEAPSEGSSNESAAAADTGEDKMTEAKEWIAEWRKRQE